MRGRGQPTKYKHEYCEMLKKHMEEGLSFESFSAVIGVHRDTLYEWGKKQPDFSDAIKKGRDGLLLFYERLGRSAMAGKIKDFNATAFIWMTKNMLNWREKQNIEHSGIPENAPTIIRLNLPQKNERHS